MPSEAYKIATATARARHARALDHLLEAFIRYKHPLPLLGEADGKDARLARALIEVLLDQLLPRAIWERLAFEKWEKWEAQSNAAA